MIVRCPHCGKTVVVNGLGRKRLNISLKNVCECLQAHHSVVAAANELNCSQGYIFNILKDNGLKFKDVIVDGKGHNLPESINQSADNRESATRAGKVSNGPGL